MSKQSSTKPATQPTKVQGPVAQAWALWDSVANGEPIPRSFAVELAVAHGVNYWTARTQAQRWLAARQQSAA